jgi:hypothetical protein
MYDGSFLILFEAQSYVISNALPKEVDVWAGIFIQSRHFARMVK